MHGESFNEGPRQAAYLMPGMGNVHFPISSKIPWPKDSSIKGSRSCTAFGTSRQNDPFGKPQH